MDKPGEMAAFVRVVEAGGFSAAARALGLTPSAISKLIGRLEDRLGARLLQRTTRRIALTHEGVAFYQRSVRILRQIEEAEQAISELHVAPRGTLRVNAAVAFATYRIVPLLPEFLERYPEVHLEFAVTDRVVDLIEEGVDVAVRIGARTDSALITRLLAEDHRVICAAPAYIDRHGRPRTPADLARHNCLAWIGNQGGLNDWPFEGPAGAYAVTVFGNAEVNNGEALYQMALAGLGVARIAEFRVAPDIEAGRLVPLLEDHHRADPLPIHVVYPHRRHLLPKVRAFVDFLIAKFAQTPPWRGVDRRPPP
ncbi:MAG: LysR family transcriptional regulator [Rhodospirillales bacterium]